MINNEQIQTTPIGYGPEYFQWQKTVGEMGGHFNLFKFVPFIQSTDRVLDFGCGGGYLLQALPGREKLGVEINEAARLEATSRGLSVCASLSEVPDSWADVVVTNHVIEHVDSPLQVLTDLLAKLMEGGTLVVVVPHQRANEPYREGDINQHLYTWNPMTLGNLVARAGYTDVYVDDIQRAWTPDHARIYSILGPRLTKVFCTLYARLLGNHQVRAVARRPGAS